MSSQADDKQIYEPDQDGLEKVMKKYDRESSIRIWTGKPAIIVKAILICFSLFCIWVTLFATFLEEIRLTSFMGLIVLSGFICYPAKKMMPEQTASHGMIFLEWYPERAPFFTIPSMQSR